MVIKHRIYKRAYKRRPIQKKKKYVYKKFVGIKTLDMYSPLTLPKIQKPAYFKKRRKIKKRRFRIIDLLLRGASKHALEKDCKYASLDISRFLDIFSTKDIVASFKPFLPRNVWFNMSGKERHEHLKKRRELENKGLLIRTKNPRKKFVIVKNTIKFSNRASRPLLKLLRFKDRRRYLKLLVRIAKKLGKEGVTNDNKNKKRIACDNPKLSIKQARSIFINNVAKKVLQSKSAKKSNKQKISKKTFRSVMFNEQLVVKSSNSNSKKKVVSKKINIYRNSKKRNYVKRNEKKLS